MERRGPRFDSKKPAVITVQRRTQNPMVPRRFRVLYLLFPCLLAPVVLRAQPQAHVSGLTVESTAWPVDAVRISHDPLSGKLLLAGLGGNIFSVDPDPSDQRVSVRYNAGSHGTPTPLMGMDIASDGTIYLVGNDAGTHPGFNVGVIRRGVPDGAGGHTWSTVAMTEPYPRSATPFDHNMNGIVLSPDEAFLFLNSGSRTDHGELQENNGQFPGVREVPLTSAILRIPADATDLLLPDDETALLEGGYLFADGTRNSFSLAFDAEGRLFGTENSGDRDDEEELNLIEEGKHYGFPWRMGLTDTPMQFPDYDPGADLLLNPQSYAVQNGHFYNDPSYPAPPAGRVFTDPLRNLGPDANLYRDPASGAILDADDTGREMGTFTSHRSPLGLVFDTQEQLPSPFTGDALMLGWTGAESDLLSPYAGEGEDLLHLEMIWESGNVAVATRQIVTGFQNPIDAELVGDVLYVLEYGSDSRVWRIGFASGVATERPVLPDMPAVDIWPNPGSGQQQARITSSGTGRTRARLVAVDGKEVASLLDRVLVAGETAEIQLDTASLPRGAYFLIVDAPGGRRAHGLIVR